MDTHRYRDDEWVSVGVAAELLGVSVKTVRRYEAKGLLRSVRTLGNQRRYRVGDLRSAMKEPAA